MIHHNSRGSIRTSQSDKFSCCSLSCPTTCTRAPHQNNEGDTGLLPSNHLELLTEGIDASAAARGEGLDLPSTAVRHRIKEICDAALAAKELHSLTYIRVKNQLIEEFGEALFASEKEHVKEMIRRTESKLRTKHDSSTSHHARRAIAHAQQRRARQMFAAHATDVQKRRSRMHLDDDDAETESTPLLSAAAIAADKSPKPLRRSSSNSKAGGVDSPSVARSDSASPPPALASGQPVTKMPSYEAFEKVPSPPPVKKRVRRPPAPPPRPSLSVAQGTDIRARGAQAASASTVCAWS